MIEPKVGQRLYSTCSCDDFGRIVRVGLDANSAPIIDIELEDVDDLINFGDDDTEWPNFHGLTRVELPPGVKAIYRDVQYVLKPPSVWNGSAEKPGRIAEITIKTTPGGCYRCCEWFLLMDD